MILTLIFYGITIGSISVPAYLLFKDPPVYTYQSLVDMLYISIFFLVVLSSLPIIDAIRRYMEFFLHPQDVSSETVSELQWA